MPRRVNIIDRRPVTMSVPEMAKALGLPRRTAYSYVSRGDIPSIRIGGQILILTTVVDGILARGLTPQPEYEF